MGWSHVALQTEGSGNLSKYVVSVKMHVQGVGTEK
jgi:hypothetical protein